MHFPYVIHARGTGVVHKRDPDHPSITLCGWAWTGVEAAFPCVSPFGPTPALAAPFCLDCREREEPLDRSSPFLL